MSKKFLDACDGDEIKLKSYFYCLRTALANRWIIEKDSFPPVLMEEMFELLPENILDKVKFFMDLKSRKGEFYLHPQDWEMFHFIEEMIAKNTLESKNLRGNKLDKEKAEEIFFKIIGI